MEKSFWKLLNTQGNDNYNDDNTNLYENIDDVNEIEGHIFNRDITKDEVANLF